MQVLRVIKFSKSYITAVVLVLLILLPTMAMGQRNPQVLIKTNFGDITVELYPDDAPVTVDNFLNYVNSGFYDWLLFHRVIKDFMIQGGYVYYYDGQFVSPETNGPIINESFNGLSNVRGTLAMARTSEPDSATAQFFINHQDNLFLDRANAADGVGYCVFGSVSGGMDAVDIIASRPVINIGFSEAFPYNPMVVLTDVDVLPCDSAVCSDFNGDGVVNLADFAIFSSKWLDGSVCGSANEFCNGCDLDYSGNVDSVDASLLAACWLESTDGQ